MSLLTANLQIAAHERRIATSREIAGAINAIDNCDQEDPTRIMFNLACESLERALDNYRLFIISSIVEWYIPAQ